MRYLLTLIGTFFLFISILIITGCDGDGSIYDGKGSVVDVDYAADELTDYMEKPDTDYWPGGGGIKIDNEITSDDTDDFQPVDDNSEVPDDTQEGVYSVEPAVGQCSPGSVTENEKKKVMARLNYIRSLHNLPPVVYEYGDDVLTAECSLIIAANQQLSHTPPSSWECYSNDAYEGCNKSNIFIRWGTGSSSFESEGVVDAFMTDEGVPSLGHRRWFIDPWLKHISFGRADDFANSVLGSAIKVINSSDQNISSSSITFVAYPYEYYPIELYNDGVMMSFSVISSTSNKWDNKSVNFAGAAIAITDPANKTMKIKDMKFDNEGYGVPNNLRWFAEGIEKGVKYNVTVTNVGVNSAYKNYSYWFELK
jgi:uncharacterized protein YkwD